MITGKTKILCAGQRVALRVATLGGTCDALSTISWAHNLLRLGLGDDLRARPVRVDCVQDVSYNTRLQGICSTLVSITVLKPVL